MANRNPCEDCALKEGAAANEEPYNGLKSLICLYGGIPFYCHHDRDWRDPEEHKPKTPAQVREMNPCASWQLETKKLAQSGYFKIDNKNKRVRAKQMLSALEFFTAKDTSKAERGGAHDMLRQLMTQFIRERDEATKPARDA